MTPVTCAEAPRLRVTADPGSELPIRLPSCANGSTAEQRCVAREPVLRRLQVVRMHLHRSLALHGSLVLGRGDPLTRRAGWTAWANASGRPRAYAVFHRMRASMAARLSDDP